MIRTQSFKLVDWLHPTKDMIRLGDIAYSLAGLNRYVGHSRPRESVGCHSVMVAACSPEGFIREAILHDATEAYLCDVHRNLKKELPWYQIVEERLHEVIAAKFGTLPYVPEEVDIVDKKACTLERTLLFMPYEEGPRSELYWKYSNFRKLIESGTPEKVEKSYIAFVNFPTKSYHTRTSGYFREIFNTFFDDPLVGEMSSPSETFTTEHNQCEPA